MSGTSRFNIHYLTNDFRPLVYDAGHNIDLTNRIVRHQWEGSKISEDMHTYSRPIW
jgi:hypothetical protein